MPICATCGHSRPGQASDGLDLDDLQAFLAVGDADHDFLPCRQQLHAMPTQDRSMHEYVAFDGLSGDEAIATFVVVPFDQSQT